MNGIVGFVISFINYYWIFCFKNKKSSGRLCNNPDDSVFKYII